MELLKQELLRAEAVTEADPESPRTPVQPSQTGSERRPSYGSARRWRPMRGRAAHPLLKQPDPRRTPPGGMGPPAGSMMQPPPGMEEPLPAAEAPELQLGGQPLRGEGPDEAGAAEEWMPLLLGGAVLGVGVGLVPVLVGGVALVGHLSNLTKDDLAAFAGLSYADADSTDDQDSPAALQSSHHLAPPAA